MLFSSLLFLFAYLPLVLLMYYVLPKRYRNGCLFVVSLFFYGWQEPVYIIVMLVSILVNFQIGKLVYRNLDTKQKAKTYVIASVIFNIALLSFFKYFNFFLWNISTLLQTGTLDIMQIALPIGISFYTFQTLTYPIDIYRKETLPQTNFMNFGMYVTFFPQLIAGPIVRYRDISLQITNRTTSSSLFYEGIQRFICGLSKKVLLANPLGSIWNQVSSLSQMSMLTSWIGILAFLLQLYYDFSGYSDMAIGLGKMFGFHFPENFNYPYISKSMSEFWRRWHMTLGTWFREYVYIPLGGNRKGMSKTIGNLLVVWFLTGLWHGASWNFVLWGLYCGIFIILEKYGIGKWLHSHAFLSRLYFFIIIAFGWILFACEDIASAVSYMQVFIGYKSQGWMDAFTLYLWNTQILLIVFALVGCTPLVHKIYARLKNKSYILYITLFITMLLLLLCTSRMASDTYNPFLYFRF